MLFERVGIIGYGCCIPRRRIALETVASHWGYIGADRHAPLVEKSFCGPDEDTTTLSLEAARRAMRHAGIVGAAVMGVWVGTESKPYAVKPCAITVAEALGAGPHVSAADVEFACKGGTEALRIAATCVGSGAGDYALAIGADTAQARPGDDLELTAAAGGAAFVLGPREEAIAEIEGFVSYSTDCPDFFRRAECAYPEHGRRFTGQPAYLAHTLGAAEALLGKLGGLAAREFTYAVFHQPTPSFPRLAAQALGFTEPQIRPGLIGDFIGNCYAGSAMLGLAATLDIAAPGDRVLCVSYGSGAASDAFALRVTPRIAAHRGRLRRVHEELSRRPLSGDYATYLHCTGSLPGSGLGPRGLR